VCAKGALFMSHIMINNHFTFGDFRKKIWHEGNPTKSRNIKEKLNMFSTIQLDLIEVAFEGRIFHWNERLNEDYLPIDYNPALNFFYNHPMAEGRLIAILGNIIANNGEF